MYEGLAFELGDVSGNAMGPGGGVDAIVLSSPELILITVTLRQFNKAYDLGSKEVFRMILSLCLESKYSCKGYPLSTA